MYAVLGNSAWGCSTLERKEGDYALDEDGQRLVLFTGGHETEPLCPVMDRALCEACHHLVPFGHLLLDDVADVGEGCMIAGG